MKAQFDAYKLKYSFFDAIEPKLSAGWPKIYNRRKRILYNRADMLPGEMGCYLSHRQVWQNLLDSNEKLFIVLEDDVEIEENFNEVIESLIAQRDHWEFVRFFGFFKKNYFPLIHLAKDHYLVNYLDQPKGTQGYIINREAAQKLLLHTQSMWQAIDNSIDQDWEHRVKIMGIEPSIILHNEQFPTTLGQELKKGLTVHHKILKECYRIPSNIKKGLWMATKRLKFFLKTHSRKTNELRRPLQ